MQNFDSAPSNVSFCFLSSAPLPISTGCGLIVVFVRGIGRIWLFCHPQVGQFQLHVPALGANRARLCIVTHKIMHIELSIIAVLVAATL